MIMIMKIIMKWNGINVKYEEWKWYENNEKWKWKMKKWKKKVMKNERK